MPIRRHLLLAPGNYPVVALVLGAELFLAWKHRRLAAGSDLLNAGVVPAGALPYDATTAYVGAPDLGAVEAK